MAEEVDVGTERLREQIDERRRELLEEEEREARARASARPRWLDALAVSTALFAVLAAIAALESGNYSNEALYRANQAVLMQARAVDTWAEFQADSIKKYEAQNLATVLGHTGGSPDELQTAQQEAERRQQTQDQLMPEAQRLDQETANLNRDSEEMLNHHHRFAISVTVFQVAIGLAAIAALSGCRWCGG